MRAEIETLQRHHKQSEVVLTAIASGDKAHETLTRLQNGDSVETIAAWLGLAVSGPLQGYLNVTNYPSNATDSGFGHLLHRVESAASYTNNYGSPEASDELSGSQTWSPWQSEGNYPRPSYAYSTTSEDAMNWTPDPTSQQRGSENSPASRAIADLWSAPSDEVTVQTARYRGQQQILWSTDDREPSLRAYSSGHMWTEVTQDVGFVEHIMALYFCWEYPTFAGLSKEHFIADFRAGRPRYCSSLLVNAMLALGCRFSKLPESCANPSDLATRGNHFFAEAKKLYSKEDGNSLTKIQAVGLMSIREASCGRDTESYYYASQAIRLAVEAGLHTEKNNGSVTEKDEAVRGITFWGAFALDQVLVKIGLTSHSSLNLDNIRAILSNLVLTNFRVWSLNVGRLPHFSRSVELIRKPSIIDDIDSGEWVPYTDEGVPEIISSSQPSNIRSVSRCFCEFAELVHQSLYTLYAPGRRLTSSELLKIYTRYLNWYSSLPEALRLGHNFTPSVLFAHMYYHSAILLLFRPFIKLRLTASQVSPVDVCYQAADAITTLVSSYDRLYTLQRTPSFAPYIVFVSCLMHLTRVATTNLLGNQLRQGNRDLCEMAICHGFAIRARDVLIYFSKQWGALVALTSEDGLEKIDFEKVKDACTLSPTSSNFFCPGMGSNDFPQGSRVLGADSALFSLFPMQGLPLLAKDGIENDGFSKAQ